MRVTRCAAVTVAVLMATIAGVAAAGYPTAGYTIWRVAGDGGACAPTCDNPVATKGHLGYSSGVAVDSHGNAYIADASNHSIRRLTPAGALTTVAGTGTACADSTTACGDGPDATAAQLNNPNGVAVDAQDNVYIADALDNKIRKLTPAGVISTVAGDGTACASSVNACGDAGAPLSAQLNSPQGVAVDGDGNLYIADTNDNRIRKVTGNLIITIAGAGSSCATPSCGDGPSPASATFTSPGGIAVAPNGDVYVSDTADNKVRKIAGGSVSTVAGDGNPCGTPTGACGDGDLATFAQLHFPFGIAVDGDGDVVIADQADNKIRELTGGLIYTIAGNGVACANSPACGDGGSAVMANLGVPAGVAFDRAGGVLIADSNDHVLRWLTGPAAGPRGPAGSNGTNGGDGQAGPNGTNGANGQNGATGPQGPAGKDGLNGRDAKVSCRLVKLKKKQKVVCSVKLVNARVVRARLSRGTAVYARSSGRRVAMQALRPVRAGRYTLTLLVRAHGKQARIVRRVAF